MRGDASRRENSTSEREVSEPPALLHAPRTFPADFLTLLLAPLSWNARARSLSVRTELPSEAAARWVAGPANFVKTERSRRVKDTGFNVSCGH